MVKVWKEVQNANQNANQSKEMDGNHFKSSGNKINGKNYLGLEPNKIAILLIIAFSLSR